LCRDGLRSSPSNLCLNIEILGGLLRSPSRHKAAPTRDPVQLESVPVFTSDPLFFHKPESVTVSAQARQYAYSRITLVEVPMGKLALFLGGFLLLTILIGILGTIPPS